MDDGNGRNAKHFSADAAEAVKGDKSAFVMTPLATAVVAALCPTEAVVAQDDDTVRLEEIIVTATKREIYLQDVPHNIDVLTANDIAKMGAKSLEDAVKALPSIALTAGNPGQNSLVIRGMSSSGFDFRRDAQVGIYVDEQPLTASGQQLGVRTIDMERIELLAGPQGTLFGSSSQSGTMRYITNKPHHRGFGGNVEARYGTTKGGEGSYELNGTLNIPLIEDKLAVRVVGYSSHEGGFVDNVPGTSYSGNYDNSALVEDDFNEYDVDGGRIAAQWNISEDWSLLASVIGEDTHLEGNWATDPFLGDHKITRFTEDFRDDSWYSAALTLKGDLGFAELTVTATHLDRDIAYAWDNMSYTQAKDRYYGGGLFLEQYYAGNPYYYNYYYLPLYNTDYIRSTIFIDQEEQRDAVEIRLTSSGDSQLQWVVGAFYEDVYDEWYYGSAFPGLESTTMWAYANYLAYYYGVASNYGNNYTPNLNITYPLAVTDVGFAETVRRTNKQTAVFAEFSYNLTDDWAVLAGIRWAQYDREEFNRYVVPEGLPVGDRATGDGSYRSVGKSDETFYKLGVRYNIDDDRMVYALFSQGVRLGGHNSPRAASTGRLPLIYDPDYLDNYEVGIKSQWLDNRLTINANYFLMKWSDYQTFAEFDQWWLNGTVNAGDAESRGLEFYTDWQATDRLLLSGSFYSADPVFTEDWNNNFEGGVQQPVDPDDLQIRAGMPMPGSPEQKFMISAYYEVPDIFGGQLWFYIDHSYHAEQWGGTFDIFNNNTDGLTPSWTNSNFSVGLRLPNQFEAVVNIQNLFDERGYNIQSVGENENADYFGDPRNHNLRILARPRTVWLSLKKRFGGG